MICIYDFLCLIFEQSEFTNAAYETMIVVPNTSKKGLFTRQGSCTPDGRCKKLNVYTIKNLCMSETEIVGKMFIRISMLPKLGYPEIKG